MRVPRLQERYGVFRVLGDFRDPVPHQNQINQLLPSITPPILPLHYTLHTMSFALRARAIRPTSVVSISISQVRAELTNPQKPLRSTLPSVRFVQTDADKSEPVGSLPEKKHELVSDISIKSCRD
jgi:hypothetical protein